MMTLKHIILTNGAEIITEIIRVPGQDEEGDFNEPFVIRNPFQITTGFDPEARQHVYGLRPFYTYQTQENKDSELYAWSICGIANPSLKLATWYAKLSMNLPSEVGPSVSSVLMGTEDEDEEEETLDELTKKFGSDDSDEISNIISFFDKNKNKLH